MRSGCVLFSPTSASAWCCSWSAALAHMSGTLRSMRTGRSRPMSQLTSLAYSTACGSPLEPSCAKAVTSHQGRSENQCSLTKNNVWLVHLQLGTHLNAHLSHFIVTAYTGECIFARLTKCIYFSAIAISYGSVGQFSQSNVFFEHQCSKGHCW